MRVSAIHIPNEIHGTLRSFLKIEQGQCYTNCGLAVLLATGNNDFSALLCTRNWSISYALGIPTPPNHPPEPHAWLEAAHGNLTIYRDPTLQENSYLWNMRNKEFLYDAEVKFSANELKSWLSCKYFDRDFDELGIPSGSCHFPTININREVS